MRHIAILTTGLWRLRQEIANLTGMTPVRRFGITSAGFDAVAGWGHAHTATRARRLANRAGKPYLAFEDGPLRSVKPGPDQPPLSLVVDRSGIFYDASTKSDLFAMIAEEAWFTPAILARAKEVAALLKALRLSKYNAGLEKTAAELGLSPGRHRNRILVLDQVRDDASIRGALADADSFKAMLADAVLHAANQEVVVKIHPDVMSGRRRGYLGEIINDKRIKVLGESVNPWSLLDAADTVYTVSSGLGFEAALAGKNVVTYGSPFYAGWGFTTDRRLKVTRPRAASALEVFAAYGLRYTRYLDAYTRAEVSFEHAAEQLAWLRDRFLEQRPRAICHRITRWKRLPVARMLDGPAGAPLHSSRVETTIRLAEENSGRVVAWSSRDNGRLKGECRKRGIPFVQVEDGFIRSAGLGASFVLPLSLVFDESGIYYDSSAASRLERILQAGDLPSPLCERARQLRERLIAAGTTKYNVRPDSSLRIESGGRSIILVPGQVEDDASIQRGSPHIKRNIDLLRAVRERHPRAYVLYKPHPDVEAGFRQGRVPHRQAEEYADRVVVNASILSLIGLADSIETITSLAGFEALIRGKAVTTHGQPFYAGWGLTEDLHPVERRTRRASLDELVAAALILYPQYLDPLSRLVCGPELLIERLAAETQRDRSTIEKAVRLAQTSFARALYLGQSMKGLARRNV